MEYYSYPSNIAASSSATDLNDAPCTSRRPASTTGKFRPAPWIAVIADALYYVSSLSQHLTHLQRRILIATKDRQFIRAIADCRFQQSQIDREEFFSTFDENGLSP